MAPAIVALLLLSAPIPQVDTSKVEVKIEKVSGNVHVLTGLGGNIAATAGEDGVAIVDDQFAPLAPKILKALSTLSPRPPRFVINTHWHFDHTGGNPAFAELATIVAHENVRKRLQSGGRVLKFDIPPVATNALPVITFERGLSLWWNGEEIRAIHVMPGHTDGDSIIWFTKSNVVHMGDDFIGAGHGFPIVDLDSGGSVRGLIKTIDSLLPQIPIDAKIIPGHGKVSTVADVRKFRGELEEMVAAIEKGLASGKSVGQLQKEHALAPWEPNWAAKDPRFVTADTFIETIAKDATRN